MPSGLSFRIHEQKTSKFKRKLSRSLNDLKHSDGTFCDFKKLDATYAEIDSDYSLGSLASKISAIDKLVKKNTRESVKSFPQTTLVFETQSGTSKFVLDSICGR